MDVSKKESALLLFAALAFYVFIVARSAWVSDDAMITFRAVENFLAGYGLGYNPYVRVQAFTHPLWLFLLTAVYFVARIFFSSVPNALFYVAFLLSIAVSFLTAFILLTKIARSHIIALITATLALSLSNAFVDFSTSGLENPLTHLLLMLFFALYLSEKQRLFQLSLIASFIMLNRLDAFLLIAPSLGYAWWISKERKKILQKYFLGLLQFSLGRYSRYFILVFCSQIPLMQN